MDGLPTKKNLLTAKQNLSLAEKGHDLLELKLGALIAQKRRIENSANELREILRGLTAEFERAKVMAEFPLPPPAEETAALPYKLNESCIQIDEAYALREKIFTLEKELAEIEEKLGHLESRIKRIKKRTSALRNIVIPAHIARIKFISERLEEHERDELIRIRCARRTANTEGV